MSLNKTMIIGNLGRDPETRHTPSGMAVTEFSVAVNNRKKNASGTYEDATEWFNVKVFDKQAERASEWLRKGRKVYVEGRMETRSWDDKESGQKKYRTELIASTFIPLDRPEGGRSGGMDGAGPVSAPAPMGTAGGDEDELPF